MCRCRVVQAPIFPHHLAGWVYHNKLLAMIEYLHMGFELDLYHPRELRMVVWYLDYLLGVSASNQRTAAQHVLADEAYRTRGKVPECAPPFGGWRAHGFGASLLRAFTTCRRQSSRPKRIHAKQSGFQPSCCCRCTCRSSCSSPKPIRSSHAACSGYRARVAPAAVHPRSRPRRRTERSRLAGGMGGGPGTRSCCASFLTRACSRAHRQPSTAMRCAALTRGLMGPVRG